MRTKGQVLGEERVCADSRQREGEPQTRDVLHVLVLWEHGESLSQKEAIIGGEKERNHREFSF